MTSNIFATTTSPLEVIVVRPSDKETRASTLAMFFFGIPLFALLLWATFLGVLNDVLNVELSYWQCLLLMLGYRALKAGNGPHLATRKNPADK